MVVMAKNGRLVAGEKKNATGIIEGRRGEEVSERRMYGRSAKMMMMMMGRRYSVCRKSYRRMGWMDDHVQRVRV